VIPGLLTAAEVSLLRPVVERVVATGDGETCARPHNTLVPLRWTDAVVGAVAGEPRVMQRLADATGAGDLRWISGYVTIKHPHSLPLWWHQDWWCWNHPITYQPAAVQVAVLCYLVDTDHSNGGLRLIPGSHRRSHPVHAVLPAAHRTESAAWDLDHPVMRDQPGQVSLRLRAGDAVVMDYRLLHATHANLGDRRRDGLLLNFTPSWRALPVEIRAHLIGHVALPGTGEDLPVSHPMARLLPDRDGPREDLPLSRDAPAMFAITSGRCDPRAAAGLPSTR
jgi:ectoine hydroxylase-related dioxygenase (phytanoyl-CoA dioxygenase family)